MDAHHKTEEQVPKKKQSGRGGPRKAGPGKRMGRPKKADRKVTYATKLEPSVVRYLRQSPNAARLIERLVKRTKDFRAWRDGE